MAKKKTIFVYLLFFRRNFKWLSKGESDSLNRDYHMTKAK